MQVRSCHGCRAERIRTTAGSLLCAACAARVAQQLRALPYLHRESLNHVSPPSRRTNPTKVSGSRRRDFLDMSVLESRQHVLAVLGSWSCTVVEQLGPAAPGRTAEELSRFLLRHLAWLAAQPAAGEFAREIEGLGAELRRIVDPDPGPGGPHAPVGQCVVDGCAGTISASPRTRGAGDAAGTGASCSAGHSWEAHELLLLGRPAERQPKGVGA